MIQWRKTASLHLCRFHVYKWYIWISIVRIVSEELLLFPVWLFLPMWKKSNSDQNLLKIVKSLQFWILYLCCVYLSPRESDILDVNTNTKWIGLYFLSYQILNIENHLVIGHEYLNDPWRLSVLWRRYAHVQRKAEVNGISLPSSQSTEVGNDLIHFLQIRKDSELKFQPRVTSCQLVSCSLQREFLTVYKSNGSVYSITETQKKNKILFENRGFSGGSNSKESACNAGDPDLLPGLGRSPGEGDGYPLQYSCLENPMDKGAWWAIVHGVAKSQMWLNN